MKKTETKMKVMWDIGSGLGGASEAFLMSGDWKIIRIENNPMLEWVPHTRMMDILEWREWIDDLIIEHGVPDFIWCSPPCREFSTAYAAPQAVANREGREYQPDMSLLFACQDIIARARPKQWIIENVFGAIPWFNPHLGPHLQKIQAFVLWGRCPTIIVPSDWSHSKQEGDTWSSDPLRANKRAYVPLILSQAVLEAITHQTTLQEWC